MNGAMKSTAPQDFASNPVFHNENELYAFWLSIGGTQGWQEHYTGEQLKDLLCTGASTIKKANPALKQGQWLHDVVMVDETEIVGYVSVLLSRLPKLRKLRIYGCKQVWPFDFGVVPDGGFPKLEFVGLIRCPWTEQQVVEIADGVPTLKTASTLLSRGCGIGVYKSDGPTKNERELAAIKKRCKKLDYLA